MAKTISKSKKKVTKKKVAAKKTRAAAHLKKAAAKRTVLANKLQEDLKATKETLKAVKESAKAEVAVLKDQLNAAMKREAELMKIAEKKVHAMVAAGEKWEKEQLAKLKKMANKSKARKK